MIICSSLLHEIGDATGFLNSIKEICNEKTIVHINVPNANSFHRLWAKYASLIDDEHSLSDRNILLQQASVFDLNSLSHLANADGFEILESGSYFIKPFTHGQMYQLMQSGIIDEKLLDGLYRMIEIMPEFGSEIYINCTCNKT